MILPDDWKGKVRYRLLEPMEFADIYVPAGFTTDGASVPRWAWPVFPPVGRYFAAAVVHDYCIHVGLPWPQATRIFRNALTELGIKGWRRFFLVAAVRFWGWITWRS